MSNFYSGQNGRLLIDGVTAAKVTNWSFSSSQSPLATTTLEDTDSTYINGVRSMSGSCRLYYYDSGGSRSSNSASLLIKKLIKGRTANEDAGKAAGAENVTMKLQVVEGATTKTIELDVLLTSASMSMAIGEVLAAEVAFQVNGAPRSPLSL